MVKTDRYKYICYAWGRNREQLFDHEHDPGELSNLATTAPYATTMDEHRHLLRTHCAELNDTFAHYIPTTDVQPPNND